MAHYVDGFVVPVPKKNLEAYRKMAAKAGKVPVLGNLPIISRFYLEMMPPMAVGTTCYECVPANGALGKSR